MIVTNSFQTYHLNIKKGNGKLHTIVKALVEIKDTAKEVNLSKTEVVVSKLQDDYGSMDIKDLLRVVRVFENIQKEKITMKPGLLRDEWLKEQIATELKKEESKI